MEVIMGYLIINNETKGKCSRPRSRGYGQAYVFLMEEKYYITVEYNDVEHFHVDCDEKTGDTFYVFELKK